MGHSYITFRDQADLLPDVDIVTVVLVSVDVARQKGIGPKALVEAWSKFLDVYTPGSLDLRLDELVKTEEDRKALVDLLEKGRAHLDSFGKFVPGSYLNKLANAPAILDFKDRRTPTMQAAFDAALRIVRPTPS